MQWSVKRELHRTVQEDIPVSYLNGRTPGVINKKRRKTRIQIFADGILLTAPNGTETSLFWIPCVCTCAYRDIKNLRGYVLFCTVRKRCKSYTAVPWWRLPLKNYYRKLRLSEWGKLSWSYLDNKILDLYHVSGYDCYIEDVHGEKVLKLIYELIYLQIIFVIIIFCNNFISLEVIGLKMKY